MSEEADFQNAPPLLGVSSAEVVYHPWKKDEAGNQTRDIMYTISLSNPLAPKTATVTETQVGPPAPSSPLTAKPTPLSNVVETTMLPHWSQSLSNDSLPQKM